MIDIYADEEFNQVRGLPEHWDAPASVEGSLPAHSRWFPVMPRSDDLVGLKCPYRVLNYLSSSAFQDF